MKYKVPEGMLEAAMSIDIGVYDNERQIRMAILEAALGWLAENPIVPTDEQIECLIKWADRQPVGSGDDVRRGWLMEWQRRMFAAPEEGPDKDAAQKIADKLFTNGFGNVADRLVMELPGKGYGGGWCRKAVEDIIRDELSAAHSDAQPTEPDAPIRHLLWKERGEYPSISLDSHIDSVLHNKGVRKALRIGLEQGRKEAK